MNLHAQSSVHAGAPGSDAPVEPALAVNDIQGNILLGFMKPQMAVIALTFGDLPSARSWIKSITPQITTVADVLPSRQRVRAARLRNRATAGFTDVVSQLDDCFINIGFSFKAISALLLGGDTPQFADEAFTGGLAARSSLLGDPVDPSAEGNPTNWKFGGPGKEADALLVFGADQQNTLQQKMADVVASATQQGKLSVIYEETGRKLDAEGHEHFGFQDGVSQPGVRGLDASGNFLNPRLVDPSEDPESWLYGYPGQYMVWPGEFVFGYPTEGGDPRLPSPPTLPGPAWSRNGSYLVFRRLRQDVATFNAFLQQQAAALSQQPGFQNMTPELLGASVIGRWHSGAPLSRAPSADIPQLGADPVANNYFGFAADFAQLKLIDGHTDTWPQAHADPAGLNCPMAAHIRKVNTRDVGNDQGGRRASFNRRLLRRGLPFGPPYPPSGPDPADGNRGLLFISYQTSIVDQFEFLQHAWMSDPYAPRAPAGPPADLSSNTAPASAHDMVVGQNGQPGQNRVRTCTLVRPTGQAATVTATADVVIPTGGGYFFSPSITALSTVLSVASS